jgi:hypothetical protein
MEEVCPWPISEKALVSLWASSTTAFAASLVGLYLTKMYEHWSVFTENQCCGAASFCGGSGSISRKTTQFGSSPVSFHAHYAVLWKFQNSITKMSLTIFFTV